MLYIHLVFIQFVVEQNDIVAPGPFVPKEVTSQDREAGLCTMSQYPTQATRMISGDNSSQFPSESNDLRTIRTEAIGRSHSSKKEAKVSTFSCKRARLLEDDSDKGLQSSGLNQSDPIGRIISSGNNILQNTGEVSHAVPDVAAAIEDLLEQTSKVKLTVLIYYFINLQICLLVSNFSIVCFLLLDSRSEFPRED